MPAANPLTDSGRSYASQSSLSSSQYAPGQATVGGSTNLTVAGLLGVSLLLLLAMHLAGFRFAFDVSVGRRS